MVCGQNASRQNPLRPKMQCTCLYKPLLNFMHHSQCHKNISMIIVTLEIIRSFRITFNTVYGVLDILRFFSVSDNLRKRMCNHECFQFHIFLPSLSTTKTIMDARLFRWLPSILGPTGIVLGPIFCSNQHFEWFNLLFMVPNVVQLCCLNFI